MARPPSANSILKNTKKQEKQKFEPKTPIGNDMFIPNLSGDLSSGRVLTTPTQDINPVNKKYVDDAITTNVPVPLTIVLGGTGATSFTENNLVYKGPTSILSLANPGTAGSVLQSNIPAALPTWSSAAYPSTVGTGAMLYGSAPNVISTSVTLLFDGNDLKLQGDSKKLYFGAANDYSIEWDGSDAVHTISAGDFVFTGGNLDINTVGAGIISILTPNNTTGTLAFGDPQDVDNGKIYYNHANTDMYFNVNGGTGLRLKGATKYLRVGDATNPAAPLHVYNGAFDEIAYFQCGDDLCRIRIADNDTNTYVIAKDGLSQIGQTNTISTNNISINATGDVGIGTTTPVKILHLAGDTPFIRLENTADGGKTMDFFAGLSGVGVGSSTTSNQVVIYDEAPANAFVVGVTSGTRITVGVSGGIQAKGGTDLYLKSDASGTAGKSLIIQGYRSTTSTGWQNVLRAPNVSGADIDLLLVENGGDVKIPADDGKLYFGAGDDASITYDGTDMIIKPDDVGTGNLTISGSILVQGQLYIPNLKKLDGSTPAANGDTLKINTLSGGIIYGG